MTILYGRSEAIERMMGELSPSRGGDSRPHRQRHAEGDVIDNPDSYRNNQQYNAADSSPAAYGDPSGATSASGYKRQLSNSEKVADLGTKAVNGIGQALSFVPGVGDVVGGLSSGAQKLASLVSGAKDQRLASVKEREANPEEYDYNHFGLGARDPNERFANNYTYSHGIATGGGEELMKNYHQDPYGNWRKNEANTPYVASGPAADYTQNKAYKNVDFSGGFDKGVATRNKMRQDANAFTDWMQNAHDHPEIRGNSPLRNPKMRGK